MQYRLKIDVDGHETKVMNGMGISIISTSRGLLTNRQAEQERIGGELLCEVW